MVVPLEAGFFHLLLAVLTGASAQFEGDTPARPPNRLALAGEFAPGIRIDWATATVELSARVVLREGPVELLACSPRTREHESILVIQAQPEKVYEAMLLVGLRPGEPTRYDEINDRWIPATGERLELSVSCGDAPDRQRTSARRFLLRRDSRQPPENLRWVFAGSRRTEHGRFVADSAGTVACVVDFDSALIALDTSHTADNAELWLEANPAEVPPVGAACTLYIQSAEWRRFLIHIAADGSLHLANQEISLRDLVQRVKQDLGGRENSVFLTIAESVPQSRVDDVIDAIVAAGVKKDAIITRKVPASPDDPSPPLRKIEKR